MVGEGKERKKDLRVKGEGRQGEHQKVIRFKSPTSLGTVPDSVKQASPSGSSSSKEEGARRQGAGRQTAESPIPDLPCPPAQESQPWATAGIHSWVGTSPAGS